MEQQMANNCYNDFEEQDWETCQERLFKKMW